MCVGLCPRVCVCVATQGVIVCVGGGVWGYGGYGLAIEKGF